MWMEAVPETSAVERRSLPATLDLVFGSLGQALVCLDPDFRVVHGSPELDRLVGGDIAGRWIGQPVEQLGRELLAPDGALRAALVRGERISLTIAPLGHVSEQFGDPRLAYVVLLSPITRDDQEREELRAALDTHCWRRDDTARALGISRTTLWRRMRELGL